MRSRPPLVQFFVRRGALRRFDRLKRETEGLPVVVEWDRRQQPSADPPKVERRKRPPYTWDVADFVVVEPEKEPE
jgi:hypothetical protein